MRYRFDDGFFACHQHFTVVVSFWRRVLRIHLVAGFRLFLIHLVVAQTINLEVRRVHFRFR